MKRNQSGFTLIEIAIVLVIIGLLLGGVLKGQELINSARVKNLAGDFKNIPVFIYGYQDKFKALPGDDISAYAHLGVAAGTGVPIPGNANGVIEGNWNDTIAENTEAFNFWGHVRLANLAPGSTSTTADDYIPRNAVGGQIGITNSTTNSPIGTVLLGTNLRGSYVVCSDNIPGKFAKQLDITLDDGDNTKGSLQVTSAGTVSGGVAHTITSAEDDTPFLVCMGI